MSIALVLLVLLGGALLVPSLGGDEEDDGKNEVLGGPEDDKIEGTPENDLIRTFLGNDTIFGGDGNDDIRSGEGDDYVEGGDGLDYILAGDGKDEVFGGNQDDRIFGDRGDDYLDGGRGEDVIRGGWGNDLIFGGSENLEGQADVLSGEDNSDTIFGWGGGTSMSGGLTDDDNPNADNDDTLVMVTGQGTMENPGSGDSNTNIALANVSDEQLTYIEVGGFDVENDQLVLTVDHATSAGTDPADFTINYEFLPADGDTGAGMLITVTWNNPYGDLTADEYESSSAFLEGIIPGAPGIPEDTPTSGEIVDDSLISVDVFLTENASLTDPISTMDQIGITTPAIDAWRV